MRGTVSLVSDFSVNCVIEGGRVTLAHLMEFSNFVDLYVFEEEVYVDVSAKDVTYSAFSEDKTCPLRALPEGKLANAVFSVSNLTRAIYDATPSRSFDLFSYDYWLNLSKNEKDKISGNLSNSGDYWERHGLLISSKRLESQVQLTIAELSKTSLTLMPSPRNLIPFLDAFNQCSTPALKAYTKLASQHREKVEKILESIRPRTVYLPPLLTVLLSRCEEPSDIPKRLIELREELQDFRLGINKWFEEFDKASSYKEKGEIQEDFDDAISTMSKKFGETRVLFYKEIIGAMLEGVEDGDIKKVVTKPAFKLLEESIINFLPDKLTTRRFTGLVDLMDEALKIEGNNQILGKVFKEKLDVSPEEITNARQYRQNLVSKYNFNLPIPS